MITQVRAAHPSIVLAGRDYYSQLAPFFVNLTYTDSCDGKKADDLNLELADRDGKFIQEWMPEKGAYMDVSIIAERWFTPFAPDLSLDCGRFWIDTIEYDLPDHKVTIKASSIPTNTRVKSGDETRGWDDTTLHDLANQIAGENQMTVDWQADVNPRYPRVEQTTESGLAFLQARASDAKLSIKVHRGTMVFFDEQKLEEAASKFTLLYGNNELSLSGLISGTANPSSLLSGIAGTTYRMTGGKFTTKLTDTTAGAKVKHTNPGTGQVDQGEFDAGTADGDLEENNKDQVNEDPEEGTGISVEPDPLPEPHRSRVQANRKLSRAGESGLEGGWDTDTDNAGASRKAKAHVRDKNKEKDMAHVELSLGNPLIAAGQTFDLKGVGQFDGKYFIVSAHHSVGPEYKTTLIVRKCLKGY